MRLLILMPLCLLLFSCKKESKEEHINSYPNEVQSIVRSFLKEGSDRGVVLDIRKIHHIYLVDKITLKSDNGGNAAGYYCHHNDKSHDQKAHCIYLDTTSNYWRGKNRSQMLFHELGHGLLKREHLNGEMPNKKDLISIMNGEKVEDFTDELYKQQYYFDELFGKAKEIPSWGF